MSRFYTEKEIQMTSQKPLKYAQLINNYGLIFKNQIQLKRGNRKWQKRHAVLTLGRNADWYRNVYIIAS